MYDRVERAALHCASFLNTISASLGRSIVPFGVRTDSPKWATILEWLDVLGSTTRLARTLASIIGRRPSDLRSEETVDSLDAIPPVRCTT